MKTKKTGNRAMVLILCVWLLIMMTIVVMQMVHSGSVNMTLTTVAAGQARARWAARGGVEYAIARIMNDARDADSFTDDWFDNESEFKEHEVSEQAVFSIYKYDIDTGELVYGIDDESAKINLMAASETGVSSRSELLLPESFGSIAEYFKNIDMALFKKDRPYYSLRDVASEFSLDIAECYGEDTNFNLILDWNENDGDLSFPPDDSDGSLQTGIFHYTTAYSYDVNEDSDGNVRLNINNATQEQLTQLPGISKENVLWILEGRPFSSPAELFISSITPEMFNTEMADDEEISVESSNSFLENSSQEQKEIIPLPPSPQVVRAIYDRLAVTDEDVIPGLVNINTVGLSVLASMPEIDLAIAEKIINRRSQLTNGYKTPAEIFGCGALTYDQFLNLVNRLTIRSNVFTIRSRGKCRSTGQETFIEAVIERRRPESGSERDSYRILLWKES